MKLTISLLENTHPKTPVICLITLYHRCFPSSQICEEVPQAGDHGVHLAGQLKIPYQPAEPELAVVDKWSPMLDEEGCPSCLNNSFVLQDVVGGWEAGDCEGDEEEQRDGGHVDVLRLRF